MKILSLSLFSLTLSFNVFSHPVNKDIYVLVPTYEISAAHAEASAAHVRAAMSAILRALYAGTPIGAGAAGSALAAEQASYVADDIAAATVDISASIDMDNDSQAAAAPPAATDPAAQVEAYAAYANTIGNSTLLERFNIERTAAAATDPVAAEAAAARASALVHIAAAHAAADMSGHYAAGAHAAANHAYTVFCQYFPQL